MGYKGCSMVLQAKAVFESVAITVDFMVEFKRRGTWLAANNLPVNGRLLRRS